MKTVLLILSLSLLTFSCKTNQKARKEIRQFRENMEIHVKGYKGNEYVFSDTGNRNLRLIFINDTLLEISNTSNIASVFHRTYLDIKCRYIFKPISLTELEIINPLLGCGFPENSEIDYLRPYDFRHFTIDKNAIKYIFPNINNDTIRFSADLTRLQIREFCFEKQN